MVLILYYTKKEYIMIDDNKIKELEESIKKCEKPNIYLNDNAKKSCMFNEEGIEKRLNDFKNGKVETIDY